MDQVIIQKVGEKIIFNDKEYHKEVWEESSDLMDYLLYIRVIGLNYEELQQILNDLKFDVIVEMIITISNPQEGYLKIPDSFKSLEGLQGNVNVYIPFNILLNMHNLILDGYLIDEGGKKVSIGYSSTMGKFKTY